MRTNTFLVIFLLVTMAPGCKQTSRQTTSAEKIRLIFDTDANNELDDQHALAYLLFNGEIFDVEGVTVNSTYNGGNIDGHYAEADRVITLCGMLGKMPLYKGADGGFDGIRQTIDNEVFDGSDAVNFMIRQALSENPRKLVILAVGKLTNVALAIEKSPEITDKIKVVWLGSNYPEKGEYNQDNDTMAMNYLLKTSVEFQMVTVRYGKETGTDFVKVTRPEIEQHMPGRGPVMPVPVMGRHNKAFTCFGDYSVNLFQHAEYYGDPPSRALFDMAAAAILKNPSWAASRQIAAPVYKPEGWIEQPDNQRKIVIVENFKRDSIIADFFHSMEHYVLVSSN
jgi:hypothetical protein